MRLGVTIILSERTIGPIEFARAVEERGFASLYLPEHTHMPVASRRSPMRAPETLVASEAGAGRDNDGVLDDVYRRTLDPFAALAAAAAVTTHLVLGTGVALVAQHDPIVLAKQVATIDVLSGGRFVLGAGYGWNEAEMASHGVSRAERRAIAREHLLTMEALWRDDVASFNGEYVHLAPSWSWPKPVQRPRVPVLLGGAAGPTLFAHIAEFGDGWMPIGGGGVRAALPQLHAAAEAAGRDPSELRVVPFGTAPDAAKLAHYASLGIDEVVLRIQAGERDTVLRSLDAAATHVEPPSS